jgi:hypothetical protein
MSAPCSDRRLRPRSIAAACPRAARRRKAINWKSPWPARAPPALRVTWLYVAPDTGSQKVDKVQIGREMVVAEKSGPWMRVYANTDIEELRGQRHPDDSAATRTPPPVSGWMQAKGWWWRPRPTATRC